MVVLRSLERLGILGCAGLVVNISLLFSVFAVFYFTYLRIKKVRLINEIPGPKSHFVFGNSLDLKGTGSHIFNVIVGKFCDYGDAMSRVWLGSNPRCYIHRADVAEQLLKSKTHIEKGPAYDFAAPWFGKSILTAKGAQWHQRRKLLTPAFHFEILEDFFDVITKQTETFVENLKPKANGEPFNLLEITKCFVLDGLLETITGKRLKDLGYSETAYLQALTTMQNIILMRAMTPWLKPDFMFKLFGYQKTQDETIKVLNGFIDGTIGCRREYRRRQANLPRGSQGTKKPSNFLDILLDCYESKAIPDLNVRNEVNTLMFGGHDTTATTIFWTIYILGANKDKQELVLKEMDEIFGESDRLATKEDVTRMKYLDCCLKESMRILPAVPTLGRVLQEEAVLGGHKVPAGTGVNVVIFRIHRDPDHFPEPEVYRPERFFPENTVNRHPYAFIPFSAGPRNCIGQKFALIEAKVVLSAFFRNYRSESVVKLEDLKLSKGFVLKSEQKEIVKIFKRK